MTAHRAPDKPRPGDKVFWSTEEAAAYLDISVSHLRREKACGRIGYEQRGSGRRVRYRLEHLEAYARGVDPLADELARRRDTARSTTTSRSP